MKKLFTFAAAVLASFNLMAATLTLNGSEVSDPAGFFTHDTSGKFNFNTKYKGGEYDGISFTSGLKMEGTTKILFTTTEASIVTVVQSTSANSDKTINFDGAALTDPVDGTGCKIYTVSDVEAGEHTITRGSGEAGLFYVKVENACKDPELTVSPTEGTGFVGDAIDIAVTSKNQSKPLNAAVTVDGVPGVYGTDYTSSVSPGVVQATPLRAGTFVITFTQASNGTYCDAEESATFVISEKAAVTSFTVEGPTSARVGDEITLTAKDFNAAPTRVWWLDPETGETIHEGETYTFTANAEGEVSYFVLARNDFNDPDEESYDYAFGMFGSIDVTIGHNAKLSSLKINGVDLESFDGDVFNYDLGEIGVYEPVEVTAIPADDPYATAVVNPGVNNVLITVFAQDKTTYKEYTIKYTRAAATELVAVSDSLTWDWAKAGDKTAQLDDNTLPTRNDEFNFADVLSNQDASFKAESLIGRGQNANGGGYAQVYLLKFHADKNGSIIVEFSNTGSSERPDRVLLVNDVETTYKSKTSASHETTDKIAVAAGDVVIEALEMKETPVKNLIRVYSLTYVPNSGETALDNIEAGQVVKAIENGQLVIIKNGIRYNAQGSIVR